MGSKDCCRASANMATLRDHPAEGAGFPLMFLRAMAQIGRQSAWHQHGLQESSCHCLWGSHQKAGLYLWQTG